MFNGTAANCLSLKSMTESYNAVICAEAAHIYTDECGAPEKFTGCKLIPIPTADGKLTVASVRHAYHGIGDQHHVQPRVISITQASEMGTVYTPREVRDLADAVCSTEKMITYCKSSPAKQFVIVTESGIIHRMQKECPGKEFICAPTVDVMRAPTPGDGRDRKGERQTES